MDAKYQRLHAREGDRAVGGNGFGLSDLDRPNKPGAVFEVGAVMDFALEGEESRDQLGVA